MMGKYCGDSIPPSSVSSNNDVLIHLYSNDYGTEAGFKMEYNPIGKTPQFKTTLNIIGIIRYGTIHLRRRHALVGRGQKFAKFADGQC